ncbi:MAG: hypothetical protein JNG88_01875 [Phycisphaerales bacterium]|nr:hypothetical protein [Phycisphaerales bacterium]
MPNEFVLGRFSRMAASVALALSLAPSSFSAGNPGGGAAGDCPLTVGPDLIVGGLTGPQNFTGAEGLEAFAVGFHLCNVGDSPLRFYANDNRHPVVGSNFFRFSTVDGATRFEQLGQSWLFHGFFPLQDDYCCVCIPFDPEFLGVGCSDPTTAARAGTQGGMGPKWQINATTGIFLYPPANPPYSGPTARRLQVRIADLQPSSESVRYYASTATISSQEIAAGNNDNNESHRQMTVTGSGSAWTFGFTGTTQPMQPAIHAWRELEPNVEMQIIDVQGDGRFIIGSAVTQLATDRWHYEYALYNLNSDRSARSFSMPVADGITLTNVGFHDVDYHSGDGPNNQNCDGADWEFERTAGAVTWTTRSFDENPAANALRWATLYNFRFDACAPPEPAVATLGLFKPGSPDSVSVMIPAPGLEAPVILASPVPASICAGTDRSLTVLSAGACLSYQWRKDGQVIPGATEPSLVISSADYIDRGSYDVAVSNAAGSTTSAAAQLLVTVRGDANADGNVNNFDIDAFVFGIVEGETAYESAFANDFACALDVNRDGVVNNFEIEPFVECVQLSGCD